MANSLKLTCLDCGTINRIPQDKLGAGPKCGTCGAKMNDGKVREIDPAILSKVQKNDDVPVLVDYWAPWCGPCRMMAPAFAQAADALAPQARFAKINTQDHPQAAVKQGIRGIPALILYKGGNEIARHAGALPAKSIVAFVEQNTAAHS